MQDKLLKREEVAKELTWRLEDIYETDEKWEEDYQKVKKIAEEFDAYAGKISGDSKKLLEVMELIEKAFLVAETVYGYAHKKYDQDTANSKYQAMSQKAISAFVGLNEKTAFVNPEVLLISDESLAKFYEETPGLLKYKRYIGEIRRLKDHMLSTEMEQLLASADEMRDASAKTRGMLSDADLKFPTVKDSKDKDVVLSDGRFVPTQMSRDRVLRKNSFTAYYDKNTWASLYDGEVKGRIFSSKARKYNSCFEAAVDGNDVSPLVCDRLFESIHDNMNTMHRYVSLRKKLLGVDELHMYDVNEIGRAHV